ADVFALGALAWYLLTGLSRKGSAPTLASEHSPALAAWDAFIDGCCRSNPARRFESVTAAVNALEAPTGPAPAGRGEARHVTDGPPPPPGLLASPAVDPATSPRRGRRLWLAGS